MSLNWIRVSVVYFVLGIALGIYMIATSNYEWFAYIHILVFGWLSSAVIGLIYNNFNFPDDTDLAKAQFWLFNIGLVIFLMGVLLISPAPTLNWIYAGAVAVALSGVLFIFNIFNNLKA